MTGDTAADILAIQDLCSRYGLDLDAEDMESWRQIWAPDAEMHAFREVWTGPDDIIEHVARADPGLHMAAVPSITIDGDRASGRQSFLFVEKHGHALRLGMYVDEFARGAEGWQFTLRKVVFMKSTPS